MNAPPTGPRETLLYQKLIARMAAGESEIEVAQDGEVYRVRSGGSESVIGFDDLDSGRVALQIDGRPLEVRLTRLADGAWRVEKDGRQLVIRVEDDLSQRARLAHAQHGGPVVLRAPMPGTVIKVLVAEGDEVTVEAPVLIIEAMKMQNELAAPAAGVVQNLRVRPGQAVEADQVLLEVKE